MKRDGKPAWDDGVIRDRIAADRGPRRGHAPAVPPGARVEPLTDHPMRLPLQAKVLVSELMQDIAAVALEIEGAGGEPLRRRRGRARRRQWPLAYLNSYGFTIAAGTSEIQRNILGERVLGLAKSK